MPNRGNEAYDFSRFEYTQEEVQPKLKVTQTVKQQAADMIKVKSVVLAAMLVSVVTMMIYNQVVISEISAQISSTQKELSILEDQEKTLRSQVEGSVSLENIEEQVAKDLGLSKADAYQIEYVRLVEGDDILIKNKSKDGIIQKATEGAKTLLEYIGIG